MKNFKYITAAEFYQKYQNYLEKKIMKKSFGKIEVLITQDK